MLFVDTSVQLPTPWNVEDQHIICPRKHGSFKGRQSIVCIIRRGGGSTALLLRQNAHLRFPQAKETSDLGQEWICDQKHKGA